MRILFKGPEGSKFEGLNLRGIRPTEAKIRDMAEVQRATGLKLAELNEVMTGNESMGTQAVIFFTLRNAGMYVTWDEAGDFAPGDLEATEEPGDRTGAEQDADPQTARTDSAPGAAAGSVETTDLPKVASRGSRTRSVAVS